MHKVICAVIVLTASLCACATAPQVNQDIARALQNADAPGRLDLLRRQGEEIAGVPFTRGNSVRLLGDGPASLEFMKSAIAGARRRVELESYEFDPTEGREFAELLVGARRRGVQVYLIYDAWGSGDTPSALFDRLKAAGVQVLKFRPFDPAAVIADLVDMRDHRKLLVVDGRLAVTGGVNISGVYLRDPDQATAVDAKPWRDTDIEVEGPVVAEYENRFWQIWRQQQGPPPADPPAAAPAAKGELYVQVIANTPEAEEHAIYRSLLVAITLARKSVHLTTGFFAPTPAVVKALRQAAQRGVDVVLLVPSRSTSGLAVKAGRSHYEDLLEAGVRIYEYQGRVLHSKTAVIDGEWSTVGSSNLDWRSVVLNNEINTVILSRGFGGEMEAMFKADLGQAKAITLDAWRHRPFAERFGEWRARLVQVLL